VRLYSEKANWWTGANLSEAYIKAVIDARAAAATQSAPVTQPGTGTKPID